jgi:hypothetical protein
MGFNTIIEIMIKCKDEELVKELINDLDIDDIEFEEFDNYDDGYFLSSPKITYNGHKLERYIKDFLIENKEKYSNKLKVYYGWVVIEQIEIEPIEF